MSVQYLNVDQILSKFQKNSFYIACFEPSSPSDEAPYSDKSPSRAYLRYEHNLNGGIIWLVNQDGEQKLLNRYHFRYMVSENQEELEIEYNRVKKLWLLDRKQYLLDQLDRVNEQIGENKCSSELQYHL